MQRTHGNAATAAMIARGAPPQAGARVVRRACACDGSSGAPCAKCAATKIEVQRRTDGTASPASSVPSIVEEVVRSPGRALDPPVRASFERGFSADLGGVRIHTDARAAASARAVDARAYAVGRHIVFGESTYAPASASGRRLIAHELAHVLQQGGGDAPTAPGSLTLGDPESPHEHAADRAAAAALGGRGAGAPSSLASGVVQRDPPRPGGATPPAGDPDPQLTLQFPIALTLQLPLSAQTDARGRSSTFDQFWQLNIALCLNYAAHRGDRGFELALCPAQFAALLSASNPGPTNASGRPAGALDAWQYQGYIQPSYIFWSSANGVHSLAALGQVGGSVVFGSDIPDTNARGAAAAIGGQYTVTLVKNRLALTVQAMVGVNRMWLDNPSPGTDPSPTGGTFAFTIGLQPVAPVRYYRAESGGDGGGQGSGDRSVTPPRPPPPQTTTPPPQTTSPPPRTTTPPPQTTTPPPRPQPPPPPPIPSSIELFFRYDRPAPRESGPDALGRSLRDGERPKVDALARALHDDPSLKVQLVGTASSEGPDRYNMDLGGRRAMAVAFGIDPSRLVDPAERDLRDACEQINPGVWTCGEAGARTPTNADDRRVLARFFR